MTTWNNEEGSGSVYSDPETTGQGDWTVTGDLTVNTGWHYTPEGMNHYFASGNYDAFRVIHFGVGGGITLSSVDPTGEAYFRTMTIRGTNIYLTAKDPGNAIIFTTQESGVQTERWAVVPAGNLACMQHNLLDIGAAGAASPRSIYAATSMVTPVLSLDAGTTSSAPLKIPHGSAPTSPVDGDIWTTTAGLFVRVNGSTVGPLS